MPHETKHNNFVFVCGLITVVLIAIMLYILLSASAEWGLKANLIILPFAIIFFVLTMWQIK